MIYPILKSKDSWFNNSFGITKDVIKTICINGPTPLQIKASWDAGMIPGEITAIVTNSNELFLNSNAEKISLNENSESVFGLFNNVTQYMGLDKIDTSKVKNLTKAFFRNEKVLGLDLTKWDVSQCTNLLGTFARCYQATYINVSTWNTINCTSMVQTFALCSSLTQIDLTKWDVHNCENFSGIFMGTADIINGLESVGNISSWNMRKAKTIQSMFAYSNIKSINIIGWELPSCIDMKYFCQHCPKIIDLSLTKIKLGLSADFRLFAAYSSVSRVKIEIISDSLISFDHGFRSCPNLASVELGNIKIKSMEGCFSTEQPNLTYLDSEKWNMSQCTNLSFTFWGHHKFESLNISNWDVRKVTTMDHFLAHNNQLRNVDFSKWSTPALINANAMFHGIAPKILDVRNLITDNVQHFAQMFEGVGANRNGGTKILGLEKFNTSNGLSFDEMFHSVWTDELDLSSFDTRKGKNGVVQSGNNTLSTCMKNMFFDARVKKIIIGTNFSYNGDGTNTLEENKAIFPIGTWYTIHGEEFTPQEAPKQPGTYYNGRTEIDKIPVVIKNGDLINIANAIREKSQSKMKYLPGEMAEAIRNLK